MAGHSHWAGIKHKKALIDNKRGKVWSKLSKALMVAAKLGGSDPDTNIRLRQAITDAKAVSMPKDNIERAIKKGAGELGADDIEEVLYEGYGPEGVAVLCDIMTDNRNRTAPEVRKIFEVCGGKLGATNCVAWIFERKGLLLIPATAMEEEALTLLVAEAGAEDISRQGDMFEIICHVDNFTDVSDALEAAGIEPAANELTRIPSTTVDIENVETARQVLKLIDLLDDHDDVQNVSSNFNIADNVMAEIEAEQ